MEDVARIGTVTSLTCPECHGSLWEVSEGKLVRFRCHTGHAFSIETLETEQGADAEAALWAGIRALEEKAQLNRRIAKRNRASNLAAMADKNEETARKSEAHALSLRSILNENGVTR